METPKASPATCGASSALDCSVLYILKGLNTFSVWISIRPFFATPEEAVREEADYRKIYIGKKKYGDGWKDFCVVKRTTTEEFHTQNPNFQGTTHETTKED